MLRMNPATKVIGYAITGALAAALLAGCAGSPSKHLARAGDHAARAEARHSRAVDAAEQAVAKSPNDPAARVALGQAYLDAGRFQSAVTTFEDAIELGDTSGSTQLRVALAQIGAGDGRAAVEVLDDARDAIPASDRGLALALAGETGRGVGVLLDALRGGENSPKLRQNLAFAYALDGQWREARIAMAQDVPADQMNDRIGAWAMMSRPEDAQRRVANLLSVPAGVADPGQPVALALGAAAQDEQVAVAEPIRSEAPVQAVAAELPPIDPAPATAEVEAPNASASFATAFTAAPSPAYVAQPMVQPLPAFKPIAKRSTASFTAQRKVSAAIPVGEGTHLVQLGSFSSETNARRAWGTYTARNPELRNYRLTITPAVVNGKNFWRVAAGGLDRSTAARLCSGLKSRGAGCFAYAANRTLPGVVRPAMAFAGAGAKARR